MKFWISLVVCVLAGLLGCYFQERATLLYGFACSGLVAWSIALWFYTNKSKQFKPSGHKALVATRVTGVFFVALFICAQNFGWVGPILLFILALLIPTLKGSFTFEDGWHD